MNKVEEHGKRLKTFSFFTKENKKHHSKEKKYCGSVTLL
jgi:hypothetical protein